MRPLAAAVSAAVTSLVVTMLLIGEAESSAPPGGVGSDRLEVYLVEVGPSDVELLAAAGVDTTHLPDLTEGGRVEIVATSRQARALRPAGPLGAGEADPRREGVDGRGATARGRTGRLPHLWRSRGHRRGAARGRGAAPGHHQARHDRYLPAGAADPGAEDVSNNARSANDREASRSPLPGRPARSRVDHAAEMVRRADAPRRQLVQLQNQAITNLLKNHPDYTVAVPVANPDGYDYTFSTQRFWRKTLRDNNGDGQITVGDGVDPNRNYPTKWGWDNEGS